jgi:hypothetical protein
VSYFQNKFMKSAFNGACTVFILAKNLSNVKYSGSEKKQM